MHQDHHSLKIARQQDIVSTQTHHLNAQRPHQEQVILGHMPWRSYSYNVINLLKAELTHKHHISSNEAKENQHYYVATSQLCLCVCVSPVC